MNINEKGICLMMTEKLTETLTENRKKAGLTQKQVAEHIGISAQAVSKWENGQSEPDIQSLCTLADLYGVSLDALVGRAVPQPTVSLPQKKEKRPINKRTLILILSITLSVILIAAIATAAILMIQRNNDPAYQAKLTLDKFNQITLGMTMDEVQTIFGDPDEKVSKYDDSGSDFNEALILAEYGYCDADFWYYRSKSYYENEKVWEDFLENPDYSMQNYSTVRITFQDNKVIEAFYNADIPYNFYADDYECKKDKTVASAIHFEGFKTGYTNKIKLAFTDGSIYLGYCRVTSQNSSYVATHTELSKHPWGNLTYAKSLVTTE